MYKVLILGAGLVSGPMVRYLLDLPDFQVTVASRTVSKAEALVGDHPRGNARAINVHDEQSLSDVVSTHDLVVSLLPYVFHLEVAHQCLKHKKHLVTTSYTKPEMLALDDAARNADLIFLNEIGLDPGIDHMSAMRVIDEVQCNGGEITTFMSYCGGLPAPEANTNPLGYKFSWSPRGVIMAGKNPAHYLWDEEEVNVPDGTLFDNYWPVDIPEVGRFEGYPNRDSMPYTDIYGINPTTTMFRGTLRYPGWCETIKALVDLGMLSDSEIEGVKEKNLCDVTESLVDEGDGDLLTRTAAKLNTAPDSQAIKNLAWLGFFDQIPVPEGCKSYMDVLVARMLEMMEYAPGERDMIVLYDVFYAEYPNRTERITSTLVDYGIPNGDSAMARTVSLPAAIAIKLIAQNKIKSRGVMVPVLPEIYHPVLDELETLGISCKEETTRLT
ncbi:MAG: saccharopine dehydrogenase C-terminal domain-containing protein [Chloroflexota bacterium]